MMSTLDAVRRFAARPVARSAVRCADLSWSYRDLLTAATALAQRLETHDVRVMGLAADNGPDWLRIDLAAQLCGITLVPLAGFATAEQLAHMLAASGADTLVAAPCDRSSRCIDAAALQPLEELGGGLQLLRVGRSGVAHVPPHTAKISYTSGTTGSPKGVCLSQVGMDTVAASLNTVTAELDVTRHLCVLPLAMLLENVSGVYAPLQSGAEIIVPSAQEIGLTSVMGLDAATLLRCIARYRPHSIALLPRMLATLVTALEHGAPTPPSLRFVAVSGGRVTPTLLERADRLQLPVYEGYSLTECGSVVALNTPAARRLGSVGRPLPHAELQIDGRAQIYVSGAALGGYLGSDNTPTHVATGDLGYVDSDGYLFITGHRKNTFTTSFGCHVSAEWVEAELAAQPAIAQVAVFGEGRPWNAAVVVPMPGAPIDPDEIEAAIQRVNRRLPDYARIGDWLCAFEPFTARNGLLAPNGRNRRNAIWNRYHWDIDSIYNGKLGCTA